MEDDPRLVVLHDHYKETFSYIRERERQRDRLFLILIGLFAVLVFEIQYPASFGSALDKASVFGAQVDLEGLPLPGLLSASWVLVLAIALRYCQAATNVERLDHETTDNTSSRHPEYYRIILVLYYACSSGAHRRKQDEISDDLQTHR